MNERWVTIFTGPVWQAFAVQAQLDGEGFATLVPNGNTRLMDPFVTGGDAFSLEVLVPASKVASALALIQATEPIGERDVVSDATQRLARLARRMRWAAIMTVTAPLGLVLGVIYLIRVRQLGTRPADHGFNLAAIAVSGAFTVVFASVLVGFVSERP